MRIADLLDYAVNRRGLVRKVLTLEEGRSLTTLCDPLTGRPVMVFKEDHYPAMEEREAGNAGECKPDLDQDAGAPSLLIDIRCVKGFDAPGESFAYCYFLTEPMYPHEDSGWNCAIVRTGRSDRQKTLVFSALDRALGFDDDRDEDWERACGCEIVIDPRDEPAGGGVGESAIPAPGSRVVENTSSEAPSKAVSNAVSNAAARPRRPGGDAVLIDGVVYADTFLSRRSEDASVGFPESGDGACQPTFRGAPESARDMQALRRIKAMRKLAVKSDEGDYWIGGYDYSHNYYTNKTASFLLQARFMEDFEDDFSGQSYFHCYYPTYEDMNVRQLREYFTWRTQFRRGIYRPVRTSMLFVYLYELIYGIGVKSPEEAIGKMAEVAECIVKPGLLDFGEEWDRRRALEYIDEWRLDLAVINGLPVDIARSSLSPKRLAYEKASAVLEHPEEVDDETLFETLDAFYGGKLSTSVVVKTTDATDRSGRRLFAGVWRAACKAREPHGHILFKSAFGSRSTRRWSPLRNALYSEETFSKLPENFAYEVTPACEYGRKNGRFYMRAYPEKPHDITLFRALMHEADRVFRDFLALPRPLKQREEEKWATQFAVASLKAEKERQREARLQSVKIDLGNLDEIRRGAALTRERLLTDEEREEASESNQTSSTVLVVKKVQQKVVQKVVEKARVKDDEQKDDGRQKPQVHEVTEAAAGSQMPTVDGPAAALDAAHRHVLDMLLAHEAPEAYMRSSHLMPEVVADTINETFFDVVGDSVVLCEDDKLSLVEDYRGDVEALLGS